MPGMHRATGGAIDELAHIVQSIGDILTTPIGSRVMRRDYGSLVPTLIDQPANGATQIRLFAAIAGALMRWEPRLRLTRLQLQPDPERPGRAEITLTGVWLSALARQPSPVTLRVPIEGAIA